MPSSCLTIGTRDGFRIFNTNTGRLCHQTCVGGFIIVEMLFSSSLLAIVGVGDKTRSHFTRQGINIYELNSLRVLETIDTLPNIGEAGINTDEIPFN
ncbi:Autophagy-related proteinb [Arachis hypogaea]|nr:Autophagy-related proteinb [Arachis hypogaea]